MRRTVMKAMEADRRLEAVRFERGVEAMEVATLGLREGDIVAGGVRDVDGETVMLKNFWRLGTVSFLSTGEKVMQVRQLLCATGTDFPLGCPISSYPWPR